MASYDEQDEVDAVDDAEAAETRLGASEAGLASLKEERNSFLGCLDLQPAPRSRGTSGQSDEEHAADDNDREQSGGRTKPSERRHVLDARYSTYAVATRPPHP